MRANSRYHAVRSDTAGQMREATVQASSCLASRLDAKNLNGTLLRFVKKLLVRQLLQAGQLHDKPPRV